MYALPYLVLSRLHQAAVDARRRSRSWQYLAWQVAAGLLAGFMIAVGLLFVALLFALRLWYLALPMIGIMIAPLVAPWIVRRIVVPMGWYRVAFHLGRLGAGEDSLAAGLVYAAAAVAIEPTPGGELFVTSRRDTRTPLGDGEVVASAFLAAGRGDVETARQLLRSTALLAENHPAIRELAGEWLAVDAAERGDWEQLVDDAARTTWPATPLTFLLEGIAHRRVGAAGMPSANELRLRWLFAPHRRVTRSLLVAPCVPAAEPTAGPHAGDETGGQLPQAIAAHLAFHAHTPDEASLQTTARAWDAALSDGSTHAWLARRAIELDAPVGSVDRTIREVAAAVVDELARLADRAQLGAPKSRGPVGDGLSHRLRHGRLDALEQGFSRWAERRTTGDVRLAIDEWREFVALRAAYDHAVKAGGLELRRLAFPHAFSTGSNMAAWLWNARNEYALSHAISVWLLDEALAVGDAEAIELGHKNCRLSVPTRLGDVKTH